MNPIRLLLTMIPQQRGRTLRDDMPPYATGLGATRLDEDRCQGDLNHLLEDIPFTGDYQDA